MHNLKVTLVDERFDQPYDLHLEQVYHHDPSSTDENPLPPIGVSLRLWGVPPSDTPTEQNAVLIAEGHANRHPADNSNKVLGRKIAWQRLLEYEDEAGQPVFDRATRGVLWAAYKRIFRFAVYKNGGR
jgi:hypothetical protein